MSTKERVIDFSKMTIKSIDGKYFIGVVESSDITFDESGDATEKKNNRMATIEYEISLQVEDILKIQLNVMRSFCTEDLKALISHHKTSIEIITHRLQRGRINKFDYCTEKLGYEVQMNLAEKVLAERGIEVE